VVYIVVRIDQS